MSVVSSEPSTRASSITMYTTRWCGDCHRAKRWFDAHHLSYDVIDIDHNQEAAAYVMRVNQGMRSVPTIVFPDGSVLVEPSARELDASWRHRYDSLVLFSPRRYSALPGLAHEGDPEAYPTKDEMADYLERYAHTFALPIRLQTPVERLQKEGEIFVLHTPQSIYHAKTVIVATGAFQHPCLPSFSQALDPSVRQLHRESGRHSTRGEARFSS